MKQIQVMVGPMLLVFCCLFSQAQQSVTTAANGMPPPLIQFSNVAIDEGGNSLSGVVSIAFSLYSSQQGGEPLWTETQNNVQLDPTGHYSVQLGITSPNGVPTTLFTSGEARWLGVKIAEQAEQPRILLLSVPYALKAGDAATIGGLPPSAFVLAALQNGAAAASITASATRQSVLPATATDVTTTGGAVGYLPRFNGASTVVDSNIFQSKTLIGVGTTKPAFALDVNGKVNTSVAYLIGDSTALAEPSGLLSANLAVGPEALSVNTTGTDNTATGANALNFNTIGSGNTANGVAALFDNESGGGNTATGNAALYTNSIGINNTATGAGALFYNTASNNTATGYEALWGNSTGVYNTASGYNALYNNTAGNYNTAAGYQALGNTTAVNTGNYNTATGSYALQANTSGGANTATGAFALGVNNIGSDNTADGYAAMASNSTGYQNTALGYNTLSANSSGVNNVAIGYNAASNITAGTNNIAIGANAASNVTGTDSNNIEIGTSGTSTDNGVISIGTSGVQTSFFAQGIYGVSSGNNSAIPVLIDSSGQLVTVSSSRRFKEDIQDMGEASSGLMRLRPVTFRYKKPLSDGSQPMQYGLIAEEVAEVYPDLVSYSAEGQIETVKYQVLDSMLLNEVQRQQAEIREQQAENRDQQNQIRDLQERLAKMEAALASITPLRAAAPPAGWSTQVNAVGR